MLAVGQQVDGRYHVHRLIGEGGMGAVYAVSDDTGAFYAMKVLLETNDPVLRKRFDREAKATARLTSPHVPRIFASGQLANGTTYLLMELLQGEDLCDLVYRRGPLGYVEAIGYVLDATQALSEAHALGMVHRDIKPANLFLATQPDGSRCVKLLDFGISKVALNTIAPVTQLTQTGSVLGSPDYMAPEQLLSSSDVDARADIWALGVTLQELLTATTAFAAETLAELIGAIMRDPPRPLRELRPDLPDGIIAVVERCLQKDPADRYPTVAALADALRTVIATVGAQATVAQVVHVPQPTHAPQSAQPQWSPQQQPSAPSHHALAHAETRAHGSPLSAVGTPQDTAADRRAPTLLSPARPGAMAPTGSIAPQARSMTPPSASIAPPGSSMAPRVTSIAPSSHGPQRWPWVLAAAAVLSLVLGGGLVVMARATGKTTRADDDDGRDDAENTNATAKNAAYGHLADGDKKVPKAQRKKLRERLSRAEKMVADGRHEDADASAEAVIDEMGTFDLRQGEHRSVLLSRAHDIRAQVAAHASLQAAKALSPNNFNANFAAIGNAYAGATTHAGYALFWNPGSPACPSVHGPRLGGDMALVLLSKTGPWPPYLRQVLINTAHTWATEALVMLDGAASSDASSPACLRKLRTLKTKLKEIARQAEAEKQALLQ